ncbi:MAG: rod shape-determining protein [Deltaproteobacteria bacterium]|nr:rod shape-determining protein [Deltaproteobacteria bacterium]
MFFAGVDAGSRTIKVALINNEVERRLIASGIYDQGVQQTTLAQELFHKVLFESGVERKNIDHIIATGYGRNALDWADSTVTEITCQAYGVKQLTPNVRTIIDIGGQDCKLIRLDQNGLVHDFEMNDRCAAGTGRFLEIVAERLGMNLEDLGQRAEKADRPAAISSMCVVFAEAEIVGLLASGESPENIIAGVLNSIAKRIGAMAAAKLKSPIVFTGGAALIPGMKNALSKVLNHSIEVAENPQLTGAYGAAVLAAEQRIRTGRERNPGLMAVH